MGLNETSNRLYLNIGYGRLRRKCEPSHPKAVKRETEKGDVTYALEYESIEGVLDSVYFKTHKDFGNSWVVVLHDGQEQFGVQVSEDSRYGADFLRKLPNLKRGEKYLIRPYDFEKDEGEGMKRHVGISILDVANEKVGSFYQVFEAEKPPRNVNGFPDFDGSWKDKDEVKIYFTRVTKFLREAGRAYCEREFPRVQNTAAQEVPEQAATPPGDKADDLPF